MTLLALETPKSVWYLMRGSGLIVFVLLSLTVALGVVGVNRWQSARWPRLVTAGLHRNLSLVAMCFLAVHVVTALLDSWIGLGWWGVIVPFESHYRPFWVGMGVLAADLVVALVATSLLRTHIGHRTWRFVHWGAWLMWPLALAHAIGAGTDSTSPLGLSVSVGCVGLVLAAVVWRLAQRRTVPSALPPVSVSQGSEQPADDAPAPASSGDRLATTARQS